MQSEVHGWTVEFKEQPDAKEEPNENRRKPYVLLTKGKDWVKTVGRPGIDPEILLERALIEALTKDVAATLDPQARRGWEQKLHRAIKDEQVSQAMRLDALGKGG